MQIHVEYDVQEEIKLLRDQNRDGLAAIQEQTSDRVFEFHFLVSEIERGFFIPL